MPTYDFQTPEQKAATFAAAGVPAQGAIPVSSFGVQQEPYKVTAPVQVPVPDVGAIEITPLPVGAGDSFTSKLSGLTSSLEGKETSTAQSVSAATSPFVSELNQLNKQIKLNNARSIENQERAAEMGETMQFATGEQQKIARTDAIEGLKLAAFAEAAQGNILIAQSHAEKAADAHFSQIESDLKTARANIINNFERFNAAEKKRATEALLRYDAEDKFVSERKEEMKAGIAIMSVAAKNYPNNVGAQMAIAKARKLDPSSETYLIDVNTTLAPYLQDEKSLLEVQKLKYEVEKARLDAQGAKGLNITGNMADDMAKVLASSKVGATTKTQLANIIGVQGALERMAKNNPRGVFKGISPLNKALDAEIPFTDFKPFNLLGRDALMSKEGITSRSYINGINLKVQQWASGASLTTQQTKQVEEMTPKPSDTDRRVVEKVNALYAFMNEQTRAQLLSEGINLPVPDSIDLWQQGDSLDAIFNK